jgi:septum formation inhibitor MinC
MTICATCKAVHRELNCRTLGVCTACTVAKAKEKNITTSKEDVKEQDGKTPVYLNISSIKKPKDIKAIYNRHCQILVDKWTQLKFVDFYEKKSGMIKPTCKQFKKWEQNGHKVDVVLMDNGEENLKLEKQAQSNNWNLGITFEKTARDTPQQNGLAEIRITVVANKARAMMTHANVPHKIKYKLFKEFYKTSTLLDGFIVISCNNIEDTRYVHWGGNNPNFTNSLHVWGEAGTVKIKTKTTPKLDDCGVQCMFVGYALGHTGHTYRMWDPKTGDVHVSCDMIWLRQMFYKAKTSANYIEVNFELEQAIHKTIEADEDDQSSSESSNKSSKSSEVEEIEEQETESVHQDKETPQDIPDDDQPDEPEEPPVTRTRSGRTITRSGQTIQQPRHFVEDISAGVFETLTKDITNVSKKWDVCQAMS